MKKTTSSALAFLLIFNQFPGMSFAGNGDQNIQRDPLAGYQSVQTVADAEQQENKPDYRPLVTHADQSDEYDLQNISPVTSTTARDRDEYSFEDGIAQFSPDYASAVVVNKIEAADLEKLLSLNQEVGITVVSGKIVMFTSGSKDEINVIPAAKALLEQSSILIHTHPEGERTGPSLTDLQEAGTQTEYVVTAAGVYAYNHDGLISQEPLSDRQLVSLIETAQAPKASSKEARDTLNKFITAIDEYNQNREISQPLRSADPLTVFARTPNVGAFGTNTASPVTAMGYHAVYLSNNSFQVDYDVTPAGAYAGAFLNFDNYATSFPTETINLSTATQIVFNVNSNNTGCVSGKCFKMEFKDIIGRTAAINIDHYGEVNITGANLAYIKSLIDMTQLQTIVFVVEHDNTSLPAGYIQVTIGNNTLPYVPAITSNTAITSSNANLAFKDAVNFSSASPAATSTLTKVNSSEYNLQFNVPTDGSYVGGITTFDDFGTAAIETADLSGLASFDLGLKLSAAGSLSVVLELEDINGNKDTVLLTGVSMTQRYWRVALSNFDNPLLDKTKIKGINAVVVYSNASVKSNTLNVQLGSYAFVPAVAPNISVTSATTNLPFKDAVGFSSLISFAGPGLTPVSGGSLTKKTDREYDINFNLGMAGSYAGGITTFDDFATVAVETANLSTLATLDLGLKLSVGSGSVVLEMEDINGNKDTVLLTGVDTTQRYWRVALSSFDNPLLDKTKIRGINVVASESNINMPTPAGAVVTTPGTVSVVLGATKSGTLNVQLGSYAFTPSVTPTAQVVTDLSALKPVAVALQPCGQNHNPCLPADGLLSTVQNFIQTSANQVNFDFNLNNGVTGTNDFRRYAGAQILFDENRRLSIPAGGLVLGVSSTSVSSYKIELIDNQNRKATLNSFVVNGNLLITRQMIQDAKVAGFDMDHIAAIVFVLDQQSQTTGHMSIQSQGFAFTPTVSGTAFSQAALDNFNQLFNLNTFKGTSATGNNNAAITANAISGNEFDLNFNLPDADDYTGVTFAGGGFDNSSLVPKSITISAVGGNLQITAAGAAGAFYQLEYSTDLTTWKVAKNNLQVNGSNQLVVVDDGTIVTPEGVILPHPFQGGVAHRFYRYALTPGQLGVFVGQTANVGSSLTVGIEGPAGKQMKLEIRDITGKQYDAFLNLTGAPQNYVIDLSASGLDTAHIAMINFVEEQNRSGNSGVIKVFANNIQYNPVISPNSGVTSATTTLGLKDAVSFASIVPAATSTLTKLSPMEYNLAFNVTAKDSYAGSINTFDDFGTNPNKEFSDLSALANLDIGLALSAGTGSVVLELEDVNGNKDTVTLTGVDTTQRYWRVALSSFDNPLLDKTKIRGINVVIVDSNASTKSNALNVKLGSFAFTINVNNNPALTAGDVSHLAFKDIVGFDKDGTGTAVKGDLTKQSSSLSTLSYDISQAASFAGAISTFDDYSTVGKEFKDLSAAGNVTLGLKLGAGQTGDLKLELEDSTGAKSFVILTGITATEKFYRVALSSFTGIDLTKITGINLVAETGKITNVGVLTIRLGDFISVINADPALTTGDITRLGFKDIVGFDSDGAGPAVTGAVTKQAPTLSTLTYNVTPANSFAGAISTFDDFSTVGKEFLNMTAAGSVTLGLKLGSGQTGDVKLELEDATGAKSFVILSNITSTEKIYRVQLVSFLGIDITKIVGVNLVLENGKITNTGALQIRLGDFIPVIGNDPALTAGDISHFNFKDIVGFDKDGTGTAVKGDLTKQSSSLSTLSYDISQAASFAGAISTFDDYSTVGKEFKDLSAAGNVTLGLKLGAGQSGDLKLELEDSTGAKSFVILTGITSTEKFYRVALSSFTGIDLTKITGINLVAETGKITNVGVLTIRLGDFISAISSNPVLTAADISSFPFANIFGFDQDGIGTAVTGVVTKQSNALATLTYNIAVANSYAAAAGSFDNPSTGSFESYDLSAAGSITLGLKLGAGQTGDVKLELQSLGVPKSYVILSNVTDVEKFYRIQLSSFAGSDLTKVTSFSLVVENGKVPNTGALQIRLGDFTPVIAAETTVGTFFSHLDFNDIVTFDSDGAAALVTANVTKIKNDNSLVTYNVGQANSYAGAIASFDDFNTVAKETMDFSSPSAPLVLKLQLGAGQSGNVKLEIQDINGAKSTVILSNVTDVEKDYVVFTNVFSGVDLTKITNFTFVLENGKISSVGALQIHLGNFFLAIAADATLTTADISHLQFVNQFGFDSDAAATDTLGDLTRINNSLSSLAYKITTQFSYAGVISTFDDSSTAGKEFKDMSSLGSVTLGMKLGAGQTGKVKLEIEDSTGAKSAVFLSNVSDIEKIYRMQLSNFVGIDLTHIVGMNLVLLNAKITNQGTLQIRLGDFIPVIGNDPTLTAGDISHLAFKDIVGFDKDGTGTAVKGDLTKQSSSLSTLSYDISQAASFAGAISTFDDYSTVGKEFKDLSAAGNVTLGLKLGAGQSGDLKLELEDSTGAKSFVMLAGITATEKFYRVVLSSFTGIDLTKITGINLVAETGKITNVGVLTIRLGDFISVINADPALTTGDITRLGFKDIVGFDSDGAGTAVTGAVTKQAPTLSMLTYNVTPANSFAGVISTFDDFSTVGKEFLNMTAAGSVTLGLKLGSGQTGDVKLELEDATGAKSFVTLSNITSTEKIYRVQLASFLGIDITKIVGVNLVLENGKITNTGALQIRLGDFIPVIGNDPALTAGDVSHLAFKDIVGFDKDGVGIVNKQSSVLSTLTYNVANPASYAGAISAFDDFSTAGKEFADLSAAGSITLGLKLGTTGQTGAVKLELQDAAGGKSYVVLSSLADVEKFYRVQLSNYTGVDLTKIVAINLVLENGKITNAGTLQIRFGNFPLFGANVAPVSPYNSALTQLASQPALTAGGGNTQTGSLAGTAQATALSTTELEYEYNLQGNATAFAFARLGNVDNSTFTLPQQVILAARGSQGALTKVEIKDQSGKTVSYLLALDVDYKNFTLDLSLAPAGFDRTQVKEIVFVQDNNFKSGLPTDLVQIQIKGIQYTAPALDAAQIQLKNTLVAQGLDYFKTGAGLDPATHLPYDQIGQKLTQPTLIGFYLQMLAESIKGSLNNGMTTAQALTEINFVMDQILSLQQNYGWKGLLTWMNLDPVSIALPSYNFIDNGNLSMSLAVMTGTLESVDLTGANATLAAQIAAKTNTFLKNQKPGYVDLATQRFGLFAQGFNTATGTYDAWVNRIAIEFRPAIAFLKVYYGNVIPDTVWDNILPNSGHEFFYAPDYIDRNGQTITNMASWDGGAFQLFWPQLFVRESDFIGTRNALYNGLLTYLDYSYQNHIPGIVSASQVPGEGYSGANGILSIAESPIHSSGGLLSDTGSTYALAAAYSINPALVMTWLKGIGDQLNVEGLYGFFDAARSNSEVVQSFVGIDVASALLGLAGTGPAGFKMFLRNRDLEHNFNQLYDNFSRALTTVIPKTNAVAASIPEFADKSFSVFSHTNAEGPLNNLQPADVTLFSTQDYFQGFKFKFGDLTPSGGWGGHYWTMDQNYDATSNELVIEYSAKDSPQQIRVEIKDSADQILFTQIVTIQQKDFQTARVFLPNQSVLQNAKRVVVVIDQNATGDHSAEFTINNMHFIHVPSSQNLKPEPGLGAADVTTLPAGGVVNLVSSNGGSTLSLPAPNYYKLNFNLTQDFFAGISINFDPANTGSTVDLSTFSQIVFGAQSAKARTLKLEFEDNTGHKSTQYVTNVNVSENYYKFLKTFLGGSVDLAHVKNVNVIVDSSSVQPGDEVGDFSVEIKKA